MKKKTYQQPVLRVMALRHHQQLLTASVIAPGEPNQPAAAPGLEGLEGLEAIWLLEH